MLWATADFVPPSDGTASRRPYIIKVQAQRIISAANEPYQAMFTLAWGTGLRAGELWALTVDGANFPARIR